LYYLRARYYDTVTAQFLTVDPLADFGAPYAYAENNPLAFKDPSGLFAFSIPSLDVKGQKLRWTILVLETPWDKSIKYTYQLYHDGEPYWNKKQEGWTNIYGESDKSGMVDCLPGHWHLDVDVTGAGHYSADADCK